MIRFLAELSKRRTVETHPVPFDYVNRIYILNISPPPEESYWTQWGGHYDNYTGTNIELYYRQFLKHVESLEELFDSTVDYSLFIDTLTYIVYIKIPVHPWLYPDYGTQAEDVVPVLSSAINPDKPYNNIIRGVKAQTRLSVPSLTVKLSEGLLSVALNQGFSLSFENSDGYFDKDSEWDLFNTPVKLRKSVIDNPEYADFNLIRDGLVNNTAMTFDTFSIDVSDKQRAMSNPVCEILRGERYRNIPISEKARGKNIPAVYGKKKISLINIDGEDSYLAAVYTHEVHSVTDKDGAGLPFIFSNNIITFDYSAVAGVYDKDGNAVPFTYSDGVARTVKVLANYPSVEYITGAAGNRIPHRYDTGTGIIRYAEAHAALVTGYTANTIGGIIKDLAVRKAGYSYIPSIWNVSETNQYILNSPRISIVFDGGDVNAAIQETLKSDMAYFIQQTDGKFTVRKYGVAYNVHRLLPWIISGKPKKDFNIASERYFSSCVVLFESGDGETQLRFVYDDLEPYAEAKYRKLKEAEFETGLDSAEDAAALARLLGGRYITMRHTMTLPVGIDTSKIELLDTVTMQMDINGREVSESQYYIVTGVNPAQDILTLEEAGNGY